MSKLLNILLASLAVLLLSQELKAEIKSGLNVTFVKNLKEHMTSYGTLWQPLEVVTGVGFVVGGNYNVDSRLVIIEKNPLPYPSVEEPTSSLTSFQDWVAVTHITLRLKRNVNAGKAALVEIGYNYASVVFEAPFSRNFEVLVVEVYGKDV